MDQNPPLPVVKTFLVCREMFQDAMSGEHILVGPLQELHVVQAPAVVHVGVYFEITCGHGNYRPTLQLRDLEEQVVWSQTYEQPFPAQDPLRVAAVAMFHVGMCIPRLGKYDLVLLVNKEEIARRPLWVSFPNQPNG